MCLSGPLVVGPSDRACIGIYPYPENPPAFAQPPSPNRVDTQGFGQAAPQLFERQHTDRGPDLAAQGGCLNHFLVPFAASDDARIASRPSGVVSFEQLVDVVEQDVTASRSEEGVSTQLERAVDAARRVEERLRQPEGDPELDDMYLRAGRKER